MEEDNSFISNVTVERPIRSMFTVFTEDFDYELISKASSWSEKPLKDIDWEAIVTSPNYKTSSNFLAGLNVSDFRRLSQQEDPKYVLNKLTTVGCCVCLEEFLDKIMILGGINDLPEPQKEIKYKTLEERFDNNEMNEDQVIGSSENGEYSSALAKRKCQFVRTFYELCGKELYEQLSTKNSFKSLIYHLSNSERAYYEENNLIAEEANNQTLLNDLIFYLEYEKTFAQYNILVESNEVHTIVDNYEDIQLFNKKKLGYVAKWENARCEQNKLRIKKQEKHLANDIRHMKKNISNENRIHYEIVATLQTNTECMNDDLQIWQTKYVLDMENKEVEITSLKELRDAQFEKLQELKELYESHRKEIKEYKIERNRRIALQIYTARRHLAAWKIQRWWRKWLEAHKKHFFYGRKEITTLRKNLKEKLKKSRRARRPRM